MNTLFKLFADALEDNNKLETLDFTKKEDLEKLKKSIDVIKGNPFLSNFFDDMFLDSIVEKAQKKYDEAEAKKKAEEEKNKIPARPSLQVPISVTKKTKELAEEYLNTMILPYAPEITNKQAQEIKDSLAEFACWIYKK